MAILSPIKRSETAKAVFLVDTVQGLGPSEPMHMMTDTFPPQHLAAIARPPSIATARAEAHTLFKKMLFVKNPKDGGEM